MDLSRIFHRYCPTGQTSMGGKSAPHNAVRFFQAAATALALSLVFSPLLPVPFAHAETFTFPGHGLRPDPISSTPGSLFPDAPSGNTVTVNGGHVPGHVYGGISPTADVTGNSLTVRGGSVDANVHGGASTKGAATHNSVTISGGTVGGNVYGGNSQENDASGNRVYIDGNASVRGNVYGGYNTHRLTPTGALAKVTGNTVRMDGGYVAGEVYGGYSVFSGSKIMYNTVTVNGGTVMGNVYGGRASSATDSANASSNTVAVNGGTIHGNVYGGMAQVVSGTSAAANSNTVTIRGGVIGGNVYGGYVLSNGVATGNTVNLYERPDLSNSLVAGGDRLTGSGDIFTGNTLNAMGFQGGVQGLRNFENYRFVVASGVDATSPQIGILGGAATDLTNSHVTVTGIQGGGRLQQAGERLVLIDRTTNTPDSIGMADAEGNPAAHVQKGVSVLYDLDVRAVGGQLVADVAGVRVNPRAKALSEGRVAGMAFVNQGADLIAGAGMDAARNAARSASAGSAANSGAVGNTGLSVFTAGQAGSNRYDTGSHVDVDGASFLAGLGYSFDTGAGDLLLAAFFEAGQGNYNSYNSFSGYASVKGNGDLSYYGGGLMARMDFNALGPGHIYADASARMGRSETDFSSGDLRDPLGEKAKYDSASRYYGAHLGLGYEWDIFENAILDLSARYFWTRTESDSVTVTGDPVKFKEADSHRVRGGARLSYAISRYVTPYAGVAYEHEFDGKAKATAYGMSLSAPDLKGGTGIGEVGLTFTPVPEGHFSLGAGVQGYTGTREGVSGTLSAKYEF